MAYGLLHYAPSREGQIAMHFSGNPATTFRAFFETHRKPIPGGSTAAIPAADRLEKRPEHAGLAPSEAKASNLDTKIKK